MRRRLECRSKFNHEGELKNGQHLGEPQRRREEADEDSSSENGQIDI